MTVRYVPHTAHTVVKGKGYAAIAYLYVHGGKLVALVYMGEQSKAFGHYSFSTEEKRAKYVTSAFANIKAHYERVAERRAEKKAKTHKLQIGHIMVSKWGYEQTNCDFYEVTKIVSDKMVELRQIKSCQAPTGEETWLTGHVVPMVDGEDRFKGEAFRKRAVDTYVSLSSYSGAHLWDGKPEWYSQYA